MPIVLKSGSFNILESSRSVQACNGIALPFYMSLPLCAFTIDHTKFTLYFYLRTNILLSSILRCLVKGFVFIWIQNCPKVTSGQIANVDAVLGSYVTNKP